jgi:hypothetical protein
LIFWRQLISIMLISSLTQNFRSTFRRCFIAVEPSAERRIFAHSPASVRSTYTRTYERVNATYYRQNSKHFYRRSVNTILHGVSCWVSSFQQFFLSVGRLFQGIVVHCNQWRTEGGFGDSTPPPPNSDVLTKLSRIPSSGENTSVTT